MKYLKKNLTTKLIVVLIVLLLFNTLYPNLTYAVDFGGILMQPLYWLYLGIMIPIDMTFGAIVRLSDDFSFSKIAQEANNFLSQKKIEAKIKDYIVGPDTIFRRRN